MVCVRDEERDGREDIWGQWASCTIISDPPSGVRLCFAIR